eukprot:jgi/Bigna1/82784/fgenesh1_pg.97_\
MRQDETNHSGISGMNIASRRPLGAEASVQVCFQPISSPKKITPSENLSTMERMSLQDNWRAKRSRVQSTAIVLVSTALVIQIHVGDRGGAWFPSRNLRVDLEALETTASDGEVSPQDLGRNPHKVPGGKKDRVLYRSCMNFGLSNPDAQPLDPAHRRWHQRLRGEIKAFNITYCEMMKELLKKKKKKKEKKKKCVSSLPLPLHTYSNGLEGGHLPNFVFPALSNPADCCCLFGWLESRSRV